MISEPTNVAGAAHAPERSVGELFGELATETSTLVRQEVQLAAAELTHKASYAGKQAALVGAGGLLGIVSLLALVAALVIALDAVMALWLSALLVGVAIGAIAFAVAAKGRAALRKLDIKPQQTLQTLRDDKNWAQRQIR
jgi:hypothetical protein